MKLRHAPALALAGWYLMMPPAAPGGQPDLNAPFSRWQIAESFDSALDCTNIILETNSLLDPSTGQRFREPFSHAAKCISTDDPRLKGK
jgi:hypothetical protein